MKKNWIRKAISGLSFTSALFIFQACYGSPQDFGLDMLIEGQVKSKTSGLPIKGVKVSVDRTGQYVLTDSDGNFSFYTENLENIKVKFEDIDDTENGLFENMDTIVDNSDKKVFLEVELNEILK